MMKRLFLATIPDDFHPPQDILLGPWCLLGKENNLHNLAQPLSFPPEPFQSSAELLGSPCFDSIYIDCIIKDLSEKLNESNGTSLTLNFWRLMLASWVTHLLQILWDHEVRIIKFIENHKNEKIFVKILPSEYRWNFVDSYDFIHRGILSPIYNEWVYSVFIEQNLPECWEVERGNFVSAPSPGIGLSKNLPHKFPLNLFFERTKFIRFGNIAGISKIERLFWSLFLSLKPLSQSDSAFGIANFSEGSNSGCKQFFKSDISRIMELSRPQCFDNLALLDVPTPKARKHRIRVVGYDIFDSDRTKYYLALCQEGGEKIVCTQHGGYRGRVKYDPISAEVEYKEHIFLSWGWKEYEDFTGRIIPLASPLLSGYRDKHKEESDSLIFVETADHMLQIRTFSVPQPTHNIERRKDKEAFLYSLGPEIRQKTFYRAYSQSLGRINDAAHIRDILPDVQFLEGKLHVELLKCKLLTFDHPGTTLAIAFAANVPTVCFWNPKHWAASRQVQPFYDKMKEVGVLHDTPSDAAVTVKNVWDDVQGWWLRPEIQAVRNSFCEQFARTNRNWRWEWVKTLWKI